MKFCKSCGTQLPDESTFCSGCGAKQEVAETVSATPETVETAQQVNEVPPVNAVPPVSPLQTADNKNKIIGIIAAVAVLVVVIVLVKSLFFGGSYEEPFKSAKKLINKQSTDIDKLVDAATPDFVYGAYKDAVKILKKSDIGEDVEDLFKEGEDALKDVYDMAEETYGKNVKIDYEITDKKKIKKDELKDIEETYSDLGDTLTTAKTMLEYIAGDLSEKDIEKLEEVIDKLADELDEAKVSKGYEIDVTITLEGKDDDIEEEIEGLRVIKLNGDWMIDYTSIPGVDSLASDALGGLY